MAPVQRISCTQCGKRLTFKAGAKGIKCPGCENVTLAKDIPGARNRAEKVAIVPIPEAATRVELDFESSATALESPCALATTTAPAAPTMDPPAPITDPPAPAAPSAPTSQMAPTQAEKKDLPKGVDMIACQTCQAQLPYARAATFALCPTCRSMNETRKVSRTRPVSKPLYPMSTRSSTPSNPGGCQHCPCQVTPKSPVFLSAI